MSLQHRQIQFHTFGRLAPSNIFLPQESWKMLSVSGKYPSPVACVFPCDCPCERQASAQLSWGEPSRMGGVGWHSTASKPCTISGGKDRLCSLLSSQGHSSGAEGDRLDVPCPTAVSKPLHQHRALCHHCRTREPKAGSTSKVLACLKLGFCCPHQFAALEITWLACA